jgi:hypothetical protein
MATITLKYNAQNNFSRNILLSLIQSGMFQVEQHEGAEMLYNADFINKIRRAKASKGVSIKTEDLWK